MPICPNGHQSPTDDWCEICGMRMAPPSAPPQGSRPASSSASSSPASTPPASLSPPGFDPAATRAAELCPQCGTPREGAALFCEECRWNFRTSAPTITPGSPITRAGPVVSGPVGASGPAGLSGSSGTSGVPAASGGASGPPITPVPPTSAVFPPYPRYESQASRPSRINRPAEPVPSESVTVTSGSGDYLISPPSTPVAAPEPAATEAAGPAGPVTERDSAAEHRNTPPEAARKTAWVAVITADRAYFTAMMGRSGPEAESLYFPSFSPAVELPLTGDQITIGRHRHSTGEAPDIDMARAPEDPGVSHKHALLVRQPDGAWSVVDQNSTNGTTVNLGEDPIRPYTPIPLGEGDRVHVGAWTTITLTRVGERPGTSGDGGSAR
ncbi:FHA domain-containing protein [Streptomyces sp. NBC_01190]|uniref:FHA domain-containing protein n=1 Tax=Streptomyces sp. NBC_01190 TaxID=2903767 RepID=UPI00386845FF|nr:FHA domain-containing protein [Streptomyces sp. NBC_01190]